MPLGAPGPDNERDIDARKKASPQATADSENVEVVRRALEAFVRGGFDAALELASPSIVAVRHAPLPDPQIHHGADGLRRLWSDWTTDFDRVEMTVGEIVAVGGRVIAEVFQRGTGKSSGVEVEGRFWFLHTVEAGKVCRLEAFASLEEAMEAANNPPAGS